MCCRCRSESSFNIVSFIAVRLGVMLSFHHLGLGGFQLKEEFSATFSLAFSLYYL